MAKHYGQEPENAVQFNFDEEEFGVLQRAMVRFFTSALWTDLDKHCVRYFGGSMSTKLTSDPTDFPCKLPNSALFSLSLEIALHGN